MCGSRQGTSQVAHLNARIPCNLEMLHSSGSRSEVLKGGFNCRFWLQREQNPKCPTPASIQCTPPPAITSLHCRMALNMASTCQQSALERVGYHEGQLPLHLDKEEEEAHLPTSGHPSLAHPGPTLASISEEGAYSLLRVRPSQEGREASRSSAASAAALPSSPMPAAAAGRFDPGAWHWQNTTAWALTDPLSAPLLQPAVQEGRGARLPGIVGMTFGVGALSAACEWGCCAFGCTLCPLQQV